jgi:glycerate-2-kinase
MVRGLAAGNVRVARGVVATAGGHRSESSDAIEWVVSGHPAPDAGSERAGRAALRLAHDARASGQTLVVLLSGGASAMLALPAEGLTLAHKAAASEALMRAGMDIASVNCVRKHLSAIKGGRLGAAAGASVTCALSDVHGPLEDDPSVIGSGPTVADPSTFADALRVVRANVDGVPRPVVHELERGARGERDETPKPLDARLARAQFHLIGTRRTAMAGARLAAESLGYRVVTIERPLTGEAREAGARFAAAALASTPPFPVCVVASGETTVHVRGEGRGGRNQEFVLAAADLIGGHAADGRAAVLASAGTDGIDGPTDAAGGIVDTTTMRRGRGAGLDWRAALTANDAYEFLRPLGDLIVWGPTGTNVGDIAVALVG